MKKFLLTLSIMLCLSAVFIVGCKDTSANVEKGSNVGQQLPENSFETMDGAAVTIPPKDGKVYVINVWATWCPPCRSEMPEFQEFYNKYKEDPKVGIYLIDHAETITEIKSFMQENNYTMPVLVDSKGNAVKMLATRGIPTTVVIDKNGIVVFRKIGPVTLSELENAINKAK